MPTIEIRQSLLHEIENIMEDEALTHKVLNYVRKIKNKREREYITKEELLSGIDAGLKDVKAGKGISLDEFVKEMNDEVFH